MGQKIGSDLPTGNYRPRMDGVLGSDRDLPERPTLPRWLAPLPRAVENLGFRLLWAVVLINLLGTAFGVWFYRYQFTDTPSVMWLFVPDSPMATLFIAIAFAAWALGRHNEYLTVLAFFGNVIFGLWTPWVLLVGWEQSIAQSGLPLHLFLIGSHLAMVVQALVLYRIAAFRQRAIGVALGWYTLNLTVDYFWPLLGRTHDGVLFPVTPHHTRIPVAYDTVFPGGTTGFQLAALGAVLALLIAVVFALNLRLAKLKTDTVREQRETQ